MRHHLETVGVSPERIVTARGITPQTPVEVIATDRKAATAGHGG